MKKIIAFLLLLVFANINMPVYSAVKVPAHTEISITPVKKVTSRNPKSTIKAVIKEDVIINDIVIFKAGDRAGFNVVDYTKSGYMGEPGDFSVYNGFAYDTKGQRHDIIIEENFAGKERVWAKVLFACGLTIILAPLVLFGFVHGEEAKVAPGYTLETTLKSGFTY